MNRNAVAERMGRRAGERFRRTGVPSLNPFTAAPRGATRRASTPGSGRDASRGPGVRDELAAAWRRGYYDVAKPAAGGSR